MTFTKNVGWTRDTNCMVKGLEGTLQEMEGTGTRPDYFGESCWPKIEGPLGKIIAGTKYKRSKNALAVTSIALSLGRRGPRLLGFSAQTLVVSSREFRYPSLHRGGVLGTSRTKTKKKRKLTSFQVACRPRLQPLFKSLDKWQLVKSTTACQVIGKVTPLKPHAQAVRRTCKGVLGGVQVMDGQKKGSKSIPFQKARFFCPIFLRWNDVLGIILRCSPQR